MAKQELLPQAIRQQLPPLFSQEHNPDPTVYVKFFTPWSYWTWYATEAAEENGDTLFFGLVRGQETELGYFLLSELRDLVGPLGLRIERDELFEPCPLSQARRQ